MAALPLDGVRVLLGVTGGIAAYKAADLVRRLRDAGAEVRVVMTEGATQFVTPLTFQALSGNPVRTTLWDSSAEAAMGHIELARWADEVLVAPASADALARFAVGRADDLLATLVLATAAPVTVVPAMNRQMWAHPATQANVALLRQRGVRVLGPASGSQACGEVGDGRMLEPADIIAAVAVGRGPKTLEGLRILVSAGPTFEDIDPVRYIGNRSSGRMGFAIAEAAAAHGADTSLVAGPVALPTPLGVSRRNVRSAREMHDAVLAAAPVHDIYIAAAAVGDFRPEVVSASKLKKSGEPIRLDLVQNPDILADVASLEAPPFLVGFAAETDELERYARGKLERKKLDMIAANQVGNDLGFECAENALLLIWADGSEQLERADKRVIAAALLDRVAARYRASSKARRA